MASVNAMLDVASPAMREALLIAFLDRLSRPLTVLMSALAGTGRPGPDGARLGRGPRAGRRPHRGDGSPSCAPRSRRGVAISRRANGSSAPSNGRWPTSACSSWARTPIPIPATPDRPSASPSSGTCPPLPPSLVNIYRELHDDLGIEPADHGDLSAWADRGVMLLNRVLTVRPGDSNSHHGKGWEAITERAIAALAERGGPCAAILWGGHGQTARPAARRDPVGRVRPPLATVGLPRLLRLEARSAGSTNCSPTRARSPSTGRCRRPDAGSRPTARASRGS